MTHTNTTGADSNTPTQPNIQTPGELRPETESHAGACMFCGEPLRHTFADLGMSPLSNAYIPPEAQHQMEPFYPLHAYVCEKCLLVQLEEFETPENIFSDYAYFSSYSDTLLKHASEWCDTATERFGLDRNSLVVEIACNDGYLLKNFVARDIPVHGVEPAANVAEAAKRLDIPVTVAFFGEKTARKMLERGLAADLMSANNVVAHIPDINDFIEGFKILLKPDGAATFEFHHVMQLIKNRAFDTIYHEHFCYHSLSTFSKILEAHGLEVFDVEELSTHGGSLRVYAQHQGNGAHPISERVQALLDKERDFGLTNLKTYTHFSSLIRDVKLDVLSYLIDAKKQGKRIAAYGAPAKGNTLLNYFGIGPDIIDYTVDRSPHKQGRLLPGTRIPIHAPDKLRETRPDIVVILAWNLVDEIVEQVGYIREWGGQFITLTPQVREIPAAPAHGAPEANRASA